MMGFHKVCHECGEKYKKKQFYKDGVHYKEQLLNDLKDSPYLFDCFDFESMFEFDWLCENCYEKWHEKLFRMAEDVQVRYHNVKVFDDSFKGEYVLKSLQPIHTFEVLTTKEEKELKLRHVKFYGCWNGYNAVINLRQTPVEAGIKLSGSLVHLVKEKKAGHDVDKWIKQLMGLEKLGHLLESGVLTEEEFKAQKKKIIK